MANTSGDRPPQRIGLLVGAIVRKVEPYKVKQWRIPIPLLKKIREEAEVLGLGEGELIRSILFAYFNGRTPSTNGGRATNGRP